MSAELSATDLPEHPLSERVRAAPEAPGCYLWKAVDGQVLYVGKAKHLRRRVASYLQRHDDHSQRTRVMLAQASALEWFVTGSEVEALLLEIQLIKELKPRYNVKLKDGKTYPLIAITNEDFPRVFVTRDRSLGVSKDGGVAAAELIGPFTSSTDLHRAFHFLQRTFRFRTCDLDIRTDSPWRRDFSPCLNFHIRRCTAPCTLRIDQPAYRSDITALRSFVLGKGAAALTDELTAQMQVEAKALRFEAAGRIRDQLNALGALRQRGRLVDWAGDSAPVRDVQSGAQALREHLNLPAPPRIIEGFDNAHQGGKHVVAACVRFVGGVPDKDGYRRFKIRGIDGDPGNDDFAAMEEVVARRYRRMVDEGQALPDLIMIDGGHGQVAKAVGALALAGAPTLPVVGLAKREETLCLSDGRELHLSRRDPGLRLLMHVRDEAHRFSRRYLHLLQHNGLREGRISRTAKKRRPPVSAPQDLPSP